MKEMVSSMPTGQVHHFQRLVLYFLTAMPHEHYLESLVAEAVVHIMVHRVVEVQVDLEKQLLNLLLLQHIQLLLVLVVRGDFLILVLRIIEALVVQTPQHLVYKLMVEVAVLTEK